MEKKIESYLHLYIGSEAQYQKSYTDDPESFTVPVKLTHQRFYQLDDLSIAKVVLILRPLSSMTEEEMRELALIVCPSLTTYLVELLVTDAIQIKTSGDGKTTITDNWTPNMILWALKKGFDLFGLIESNLAVEKK